MNALERQVYLDALGIQQWVPKEALPNAKTAEYVTAESLLAVEAPVVENEIIDSSVETKTAVEQVPVVEVKAEVETVNEAMAEAVAHVVETAVPQTTAPQALVENQVSAQTENVSEPQVAAVEKTEAKTEAKTEQESSEPVKLSVVRLGQQDSHCIFADVLDSAGQVSRGEHELINNIHLAIYRTWLQAQGVDQTMPALDSFNWPMFDHQSGVDQSLKGAGQAARAFLQAGVQKKQAALVIVLGDQASQFVSVDADVAPGLNTVKLVKGEQVIYGPSLDSMIKQPMLKKELWLNIVAYFSQHTSTPASSPSSAG